MFSGGFVVYTHTQSKDFANIIWGYFPVNTHAHNTGTLSLTNLRSYQILGTVAARGAAKSRVVSILNHGLMTGMIWGTAILGHLHILGIIMIQPAIPGRTLLVLNTAQVGV